MSSCPAFAFFGHRFADVFRVKLVSLPRVLRSTVPAREKHIALKEYEPFDPLPISLPGAQGVMMKAHHFPHLLPQPGLGVGNQLVRLVAP